MHPSIVRLQTGQRTPIENIVCQTSAGSKRWVEAYRKFARAGGQSVQLHKDKLGRQTSTFNSSEFRNWVWEQPQWTVCVSRRGVEFDVPYTMKPREAWQLWRSYLRMLGL